MQLNFLNLVSLAFFSSALFFWDFRISLPIFKLLIPIWAIFFLFAKEGGFKFIRKDLSDYFVPFYLTLFAIIFHFLFASYIYSILISQREILSLIALIIVAIFFRANVGNLNNFTIRSISFFFILNLIIQILEIFDLLNFSSKGSYYFHQFPSFARRAGLLGEPSHLALVYVPIYFAVLNCAQYSIKSIGKLPLICGLISLALCPCSTLYIGIFLICFYFFIFRRKYYLIYAFLVYFLVFYTSFLQGDKIGVIDNFFTRILGFLSLLNSNQFDSNIYSSDSSVLVTFVHLKYSIWVLLNYPFGLGLNMYGMAIQDFLGQNLMPEFLANNIFNNYNDGSSNIFKIIAEFGIFSFIIIGALIVAIFRFKKTSKDFYFYFSLALVFLSFIRGAGYFNSGFFFSFYYLVFKIRSEKK